MKQRYRAKLIRAFAIALFGFGLGACCYLFPAGVKVNVTNEGSEPISVLKINFKGGNETLSELGVGSTHEFIVKPSGESAIDISFLDAKGNARNYKVDVYIETSSQGRIDIRVDRLGNVRWEDHITSCP